MDSDRDQRANEMTDRVGYEIKLVPIITDDDVVAYHLENPHDRMRAALRQIVVCCDNGATDENKLAFIRAVARKALPDDR